MRYLTGGRPTPREQIRDQIIPFHLGVYDRLDRLGTWAAESTATGEFLGWFHLRPGHGSDDITNIELGYRLRRSSWNKGYATEGSRALVSMGFTDLDVERVFALTMTVNTASRHVLEKCGLTLARTTGDARDRQLVRACWLCARGQAGTAGCRPRVGPEPSRGRSSR